MMKLIALAEKNNEKEDSYLEKIIELAKQQIKDIKTPPKLKKEKTYGAVFSGKPKSEKNPIKFLIDNYHPYIKKGYLKPKHILNSDKSLYNALNYRAKQKSSKDMVDLINEARAIILKKS